MLGHSWQSVQHLLPFRTGCGKLARDAGCWLFCARTEQIECNAASKVSEEMHAHMRSTLSRITLGLALQTLHDRYGKLLQARQGVAMISLHVAG